MTNAQPSSLTGRHKSVLIGGARVLLAGVSALVLLRPAPACEGVFEQTAPRLEANIGVIKNKGGVAVSQEKVQELKSPSGLTLPRSRSSRGTPPSGSNRPRRSR